MRQLLSISIFVALIGSGAYGQSPWQTCVDNANAALQMCITNAKNTLDASLATDLANYNDCIDPASPKSTGLAGCYRMAIQTCGTDNTCLTTQRNDCDAQFLRGQLRRARRTDKRHLGW